MRVVVDTNVLVSGYLSPFGAPAQVVDLIVSGRLAVLLDERILCEYQEVLVRPRFGIARDVVDSLLEYLSREGESIVAAPLKTQLPDDDDLVFLEVAVAGQTDALVTGNLRHFPKRLVSQLGVVVWGPSELLRHL